MKKLTLFIFCAFFITKLYSQTVDPNAWDGKIYFKVKNSANINLPDYNSPGTYLAAFNPLIIKYGITKIFKPFKRLNNIDIQNVYQVDFSVIDSVTKLIVDLSALNYIEFAEKIPYETTFITPSDYSSITQWGLNQIQADLAWNIYPASLGSFYPSVSNNVKIAIIDNEINTSHIDLSGVLWTNSGEIPLNGVDDDGNGYLDDANGFDVADSDPITIGPLSFDHGTHCAGIACAQTDNAIGISGLGNCKLMPIKVTSNSASGTTITAGWLGVEYAIVNEADVISISWGSNLYSSVYDLMIANALANNIIVVAAAGNSNVNLASSPVYPALYTGVVTVGSTGTPTLNDEKSSFSNFGVGIDVMAPGYNIYSTLSNGGYGYKSGTSMATPLVAGLCGLMKTFNPYLSNTTIVNCITTTCNNINSVGVNSSFVGMLGSGRINANLAMICINTAPLVSFNANSTVICEGTSTQFFNTSSGAPPITGGISWNFPGGTPSSSTSSSPVITYNTSGIYPVSLTITNAFGTASSTITSYINVNTCSTLVSSNNNWYFGNKGTLGFSTGIGVSLLNGTSINTIESCSSISNASGNLLFYTDGRLVYNKNHLLMPNCITPFLNGSPNTPGSGSSTQGALIVPNPANTNQYYIFTTSDREMWLNLNYGLSYTLIDMTLDSGNGDIVSGTLNTPAPGGNPHTSEHLAAIPDCGNGYWILVHNVDAPDNDKILSYHLTSGGLTSPVISNSLTLPSYVTGTPLMQWFGHLKVSPDGTKVVLTTETNVVQLYNFNKTTGALTIASTITLPWASTNPTGVSFSPNSNVLYFSAAGTILQYDVTTIISPILNYTSTVPIALGNHQMRLGPDNRIYFNNSNKLDLINFPDNLNTAGFPNAFGFVPSAVSLAISSSDSRSGLPNIIDSKSSTTPYFTYSLTTCNTAVFNTPNCPTLSWNFGDPASGVANTSTAINPTHVFSGSGTYNVTLTTSTGSFSLPVVILPSTLTITGPTTICSNAIIPASYSTGTYSGYSYSWTATTGGFLGANNTPSVNINWTSPGINNTTVTVYSSGCVKTGSLNVNVVNAPVANAGPDFYTCDVASFTLGGSPSASGGLSPYSYSWTPATALTCTTCANPSANPTATINYTLTVTDANGCSSTDNSVVYFDNVCAAGTGGILYNVPTTIVSGTTLTGNYAFNADVTISGSVNFNLANIAILTNKKIIVPNGSTLTIANSFLHGCSSCGGNMWYGIELQNGGTLILNPSVNSASLITDAINAINTESNTAVTPVPIYQVERTIFNLNNTDIRVLSHPGAFATSFIRNTIFTSRSGISTVLASLPTTFSNFKTALITNTTASLSSYPTANLLTGGRSKRAVDISNKTGSALVIGSTTSAGNLNIFDHHDYGIYFINSNVNVFNNLFENFKGFTPIVTPFTPVGVCIYAPVTNGSTSNLLVGGLLSNQSNTFSEFYRGIETNYGYSINALNNLFTTSNNTGVVNTTSPVNLGDAAFFIKNITNALVVTDSNRITNCKYGVFLNRNTVAGTTYNPATISIERNRVSQTSTGIVTAGVLLQDISGNTITTINTITVGDNTFKSVNTGIRFSYIRNRARAFNNSIRLNGTASNRYGIYILGCDKAEAKNNTIFNVTGSPITNTAIRGIYTQLSTNNKIFCNTITHMGEGLTFEGTCTSTYTGSGSPGVLSNTLNSCNRGLVLRNTGVIGSQGNATASANFVFSPNTAVGFPGGFTYNFNSATANTASKLWNTTGLVLGSNHQTNNPGDEYTYLTPFGLNNSSAILAASCPTTLLSIAPSSGGGEFESLSSEAAVEEEEVYYPLTSEFTSELWALVKEEELDLSYPFKTEAQWFNSAYAINTLIDFPGLLDLDENLNTWSQLDINQNHYILNKVNTLVNQENYTDAFDLINSFSANNTPELNHQIFWQIQLKHLLNGTNEYDFTDLENLWIIAKQCPLTGGLAVYQSRNLLTAIYNTVLEFEDHCEEKEKISWTIDETEQKFSLYPNPSNGLFMLNYDIAHQVKAIVYDVNGKQVATYTLNPLYKQKQIDLSGLVTGIYKLNVVNDGSITFESKLVLVQ